MAEPIITVAVIGGISSVAVTALGIAGNVWQTRRKNEPKPAKDNGEGVDMTAVVSVLGQQLAEKDAALEEMTRRAIACEARESLRNVQQPKAKDRRS